MDIRLLAVLSDDFEDFIEGMPCRYIRTPSVLLQTARSAYRQMQPPDATQVSVLAAT